MGSRVRKGEPMPLKYSQRRGQDKPPKITVRKCMTCGEDFYSEGIGNRMCDHCRYFASEGMV